MLGIPSSRHVVIPAPTSGSQQGGPYDSSHRGSSIRATRVRVLVVPAAAGFVSQYGPPSLLPGPDRPGDGHAVLRAVRRRLGLDAYPDQPAHDVHVLRADAGLR